MNTTQDKKINLEIVAKIKVARLEKNLTQEELAKKAGINGNFYAKVERGKAKPSGVTLTKLIKALGLKSTDIFSV